MDGQVSASRLAKNIGSKSVSNELQALLDRVATSDLATAKELRRHVDALQSRRQFGLNFERHTPESVALTGRPISVGDKVRFLPERGQAVAESDATWIVTKLSGRKGSKVAHLLDPVTRDEASRAVADLVFVADFRDPIYPGLVSVGEPIRRGGDKPVHTVINGENFHVLEALEFTSQAAVDCIYIDPPYNTGTSDWIYNDKHVDPSDSYIHSKWLAFMERRLDLAKRLLKPTGVIIVAIGDDEHHRLRMLMDQVFGEVNFISNVVWQGGRKNDSRFVSNGADYMLVYARDAETLRDRGVRWREKKAGVEEALAAASEIWSTSGGDHSEATKRWKAWLKEFKRQGNATDAVTRFVTLDDEGRPIRTDGTLRSPSPRPNLRYDLLHPVTGLPVRMHPNGWCYSKETMDRLVADGMIHFGPDHTTGAGGVSRLESMDSQVAESVFVRDRNPSNRHLAGVLGERRFPNPKDHEVLARWIDLTTPADAVVLDFFGGSGTTAEAVMRLNEKDGGTRRAILVTNNELSAADARKMRRKGLRPGDPEWEAKGVFQHVCRPRITTVATGVREDGSTYSEGLETNVEFFTLTYENPALVELNLAYERIAPLLWMRAGSQGRIITERTETFDVAERYAVLFSVDSAKQFLSALAGAEGVRIAYIVTDDPTQFQAISGQLPDGVESVRLYESYLRTFEINNGRA